MTIVMIRLKIKLPDNISDKKWNELLQKYLSVNPYKSVRATRYNDVWEHWL
jgi:hypothetical protein